MVSRSLVSVALVALLLGAGCAKSDPIGGAGGGSAGEGGWGGGWDEDGTSDEAGPETGAGAGLSTASGEDGDPVEGGGGPGEGGSTSSGPSCGDGVCSQPDEACEVCEADCGPCAGTCGDGACTASEGESCDTCAADCGACPTCGDGVCSQPAENCDVCFEDCGVCACEPDDLEPNAGSGSAKPLTLNTEVTDLSICEGDFDWFSFGVNGTRTVAVSFNFAEGDLDLEIYSQASGSYVTGSYSDDDDEQVVLSGLPSGTYWARVYGYQGATNPQYAILVSD